MGVQGRQKRGVFQINERAGGCQTKSKKKIVQEKNKKEEKALKTK